MTDQQHPITIPPDLEEELLALWPQDALQRAAQWGADQELQACYRWLIFNSYSSEFGFKLRAARRPKPPSLAEGPTRKEAVAVYSEVMATHECQTLGEMAEHFARAVLARWGK